ncbi:MAG: hypothetical protein DMG15_25940 [Acidobacteria bacterium]|nr:MAG: hypothetical protein DMG15_25940 [Acidobacteriota bacterium]
MTADNTASCETAATVAMLYFLCKAGKSHKKAQGSMTADNTASCETAATVAMLYFLCKAGKSHKKAQGSQE